METNKDPRNLNQENGKSDDQRKEQQFPPEGEREYKPEIEFPGQEQPGATDTTNVNSTGREHSTRTDALRSEREYDGASGEERERSGPDERPIIPDTPPSKNQFEADTEVNPDDTLGIP